MLFDMKIIILRQSQETLSKFEKEKVGETIVLMRM